MPSDSPIKKSRSIAVRLEDEDFRFLELLAERLELPTDGRPILSRAVQQVVKLMRSSFAVEAISGQGTLRPLCLQGSAA